MRVAGDTGDALSVALEYLCLEGRDIEGWWRGIRSKENKPS